MKTFLSWLLAAAMVAATLWAMQAPNAISFREPELARMIFFHLPCAFTGLLFLFFGSYHSIRFLTKRDMACDVRAAAANEMAVILFSLTMITGMLFSKAQWGAYWQGDPRQTSFLMNLLIVGAYMILRMAFPDEQRRAHTSAVYNVASLLPTIFLVGVYPRLKQVVQVSSHPSTTIQQGLLKGEYGEIFLLVWGLLLATTIWMYRQRAKAGELELELESHNAKLDVRGDSAHIGVVRPVSVSERDS